MTQVCRSVVLPLLTALSGIISAGSTYASPDWRQLAPPVVDGPWLRPARQREAQPVWGHAQGLRVGLSPMPGPRGLLKVYAPYLGHADGRVINFIAVEPIPKGETHRGLSELEPSRLDDTRGKRFWSVDCLEDNTPRAPEQPARGVIEQVGGQPALRVYVPVERFENGAHVFLRLTFRADRPHEVGIATFAHQDSVALEHCIVTATMGNFARLRELHLAERTLSATELWPGYRGTGFTPHVQFSLAELHRCDGGDAFVSATPDERDPSQATYHRGTSRHWRYDGKVAKQSWRSENPDPRLEVWVNGRWTYWASQTPISGGISFENFEMVAPFRQGEEFWFGVEPVVE